jgi:AcrR family transcriptional regulator
VAGATRKRRSDAARNREAILAVALAALTGPGEVSLNAIAQRAGVANATLYRHFPTREALVLEVYRHEVRQLVATADQLLADREPADALREWVARLAQYAMTKHGLAQAIRAAASPGSALFEETYSPIVAALGRRHPRPGGPVGDRPRNRLESPGAHPVRPSLHRPQSLTRTREATAATRRDEHQG